MTAPYKSLGRQVLRGQTHIALAATAVLADRIAIALNEVEHIDEPVMPELRHAVRCESDEYVCSCGSRWPRSEGSDHP